MAPKAVVVIDDDPERGDSAHAGQGVDNRRLAARAEGWSLRAHPTAVVEDRVRTGDGDILRMSESNANIGRALATVDEKSEFFRHRKSGGGLLVGSWCQRTKGAHCAQFAGETFNRAQSMRRRDQISSPTPANLGKWGGIGQNAEALTAILLLQFAFKSLTYFSSWEARRFFRPSTSVGFLTSIRFARTTKR